MFLPILGVLLFLDIANDAVEELVIPAMTHKKYKGKVKSRTFPVEQEYRGAFTPEEVQLYRELEHDESRAGELAALQARVARRDQVLRGMVKE